MLFVSGVNDNFLKRSWITGPKGIAALQDVRGRMPVPSNVTVCGIPGAGHNALGANNSKRPERERAFCDAVRRFIGIVGH